ncbi:MAG TPA: AraC family transcriptional regulator [Ramlibacter sp.]|uniref:AraC family transcriptional regulator n=1 Tax=Ramlibacter sp. TaxID=1917967 RepID=UPI002C7F7C79|nr:AraC family transcriptional regulator [Ramlibacter sp.]HVZ44023.1 AraC family transcriptional regulator [Ramlibacter sp.]
MKHPASVTPMAFARSIVSAYRRAGRDPARVLKLAQIAPARLQIPEARITARQLEELSYAAMQELDDEGLGAFSRRLPWGTYGMLARASLTSPTLGVALKRWCRHHALVADDIALALTATGSEAAIALRERRRLASEHREFCMVHVLRNVHGLACWYIDSRIPLAGASFPFRAPPHADAYRFMFPGPLGFDADGARIRFDARYLALPLKRDEKALGQMLERALPLTVLQYRRDRLIVEQVRMALRSHPAEAHGADGLARLLHMSTRTLHRHLKEEGASLQELKDEVRSGRARELLLRTGKAVKQVASASGFRSERSFVRAFAKWTGMTPAQFRAASGAAE